MCAYLLLVSVLISISPVGQLLKVPILFEHFTEHKEIDRSISILRFLVHHYSSEEHFDDDHDRDMQLPFKSVTHQLVGFDYHSEFRDIYLPSIMFQANKIDYGPENTLGFLLSYHGSLFKPPRS